MLMATISLLSGNILFFKTHMTEQNRLYCVFDSQITCYIVTITGWMEGNGQKQAGLATIYATQFHVLPCRYNLLSVSSCDVGVLIPTWIGLFVGTVLVVYLIYISHDASDTQCGPV